MLDPKHLNQTLNSLASRTDMAQEPKDPNISKDEASSLEDVDVRKEVFRGTDPVLAKKMALINTAIDEIGMTAFQWKLFCLNGFGYAVDSVSELQ